MGSSFSSSQTKDQRVVADDMSGVFLSPESKLNMSQSVGGDLGIGGDSVNQIIDTVLKSENRDLSMITDLSKQVTTGLTQQSSRLADMVEAVKSPEGTDFKKYLPYAAVALVALMVWRK